MAHHRKEPTTNVASRERAAKRDQARDSRVEETRAQLDNPRAAAERPLRQRSDEKN